MKIEGPAVKSGLLFNPNRSLGFMSAWYLFRADWPHHCRRRSGLRRDRDVDKMPKEMLIWHEYTYKKDILTNCRSNDRFGFNMSEFRIFSAFAPISAYFRENVVAPFGRDRLSVGYNAPQNSPLALLRATSHGTLSKATGFLHILPHGNLLEVRTKSHGSNL